jgi:hypothetical protein
MGTDIDKDKPVGPNKEYNSSFHFLYRIKEIRHRYE